MADEILRSKHAFGDLKDLELAIANKKVDAYDVLFMKDKNGNPVIGWLDKDIKPFIVDTEKVIVVEGDSLPESGESGKIYIFGEDGYFWNGSEFVNLCKPTDVSALEAEITTKVTAEEVKTMIKESEDSLVEILEF